MRKYNRIFLIVLDSLGIGAMADSEKFGDVGVNTFGHIWESQGGLEIPNLRRLGMGNLCGVTEDEAKSYARRLNEASNGKDTMTGHWEMMGIYTTKPFVTFTDHGFPKELIDELEKRTGRKIIGNKAASGTEILDELAERDRKRRTDCLYLGGFRTADLRQRGDDGTGDAVSLLRDCP